MEPHPTECGSRPAAVRGLGTANSLRRHSCPVSDGDPAVEIVESGPSFAVRPVGADLTADGEARFGDSGELNAASGVSATKAT